MWHRVSDVATCRVHRERGQVKDRLSNSSLCKVAKDKVRRSIVAVVEKLGKFARWKTPSRERESLSLFSSRGDMESFRLCHPLARLHDRVLPLFPDQNRALSPLPPRLFRALWCSSLPFFLLHFSLSIISPFLPSNLIRSEEGGLKERIDVLVQTPSFPSCLRRRRNASKRDRVQNDRPVRVCSSVECRFPAHKGTRVRLCVTRYEMFERRRSLASGRRSAFILSFSLQRQRINPFSVRG